MKIQSNNLLENLSKKELETLTSVVSETILRSTEQKNSFGSIDLWAIQKQRKVSAIRNIRY